MTLPALISVSPNGFCTGDMDAQPVASSCHADAHFSQLSWLQPLGAVWVSRLRVWGVLLSTTRQFLRYQSRQDKLNSQVEHGSEPPFILRHAAPNQHSCMHVLLILSQGGSFAWHCTHRVQMIVHACLVMTSFHLGALLDPDLPEQLCE